MLSHPQDTQRTVDFAIYDRALGILIEHQAKTSFEQQHIEKLVLGFHAIKDNFRQIQPEIEDSYTLSALVQMQNLLNNLFLAENFDIPAIYCTMQSSLIEIISVSLSAFDLPEVRESLRFSRR